MSEPTTDAGKASRLKKLTSTSTWVSPFRSSGPKKNLRKQLQDDSAISKVQVPRKFASHPTLEAQKKKEAADKKAAEKAAKEAEEAETPAAEPEASTKSLKNEPIDTPKQDVGSIDDEVADEAAEEVAVTTKETVEPVEAVEEPVKPAEEAVEVVEAAETTETAEPAEEAQPELAGDDNIEQQVKENPIELVVQPEAKYVPVELPNQAILDSLKDKPNLLGRYQELNAAAIGSLSNTVDDPNKIIDLGSGLKMTQQQLLDIAAKRVAPVLANINDEVSKTRSEDEIKRQDAIKGKVDAHEKKLLGIFDKHVQKIEKSKTKFDGDIEKQLGDLTRIMGNNRLAAETFEATTLEEIETAKTDYETRELNAVEKHETDKETLVKNHEELLATKKQELEDAKTGQETTTKDIETLQEKKVELDNQNSELNTQVDELTNTVNEKLEALESLKVKLAEKKEGVAKNKSTKETLVGGISKSKEDIAAKKSAHDKLSAEVGILAGVLSAYAAKLTFLSDDKKERQSRLGKAKDSFSSWEKEKQDTAKAVALEHERKRAEALEAAETAQVEAEIERKRLQDEAETKRVQEELERQRLKEEEERQAEEAEEQKKKDAQHEAQLAKDQEEWEAQQQREYHEKMKNDPEYLRSLRIKEREDEQARLLNEKERSEIVYQERKEQEELEALQLQKDIEELKAQQNARAEEERLEAERLAQSKLDEIERLKQEHEAKLALYRQRLELEELQKTRLLEEVENLKKIRELREEKARLALEVNKNSKLDDIQKLIEERELEVARLTKQIELDDGDLYKATKQTQQKSFLGTSNDLPVSAERGASSKEEEPKSKSNVPAAVVAAGIAAGATGAAIAGAAASSAKPKSVPSVPQVSDKGLKKENSLSKGSLSRFKSWKKKLSISDKSGEAAGPAPEAKKAAKVADSKSKSGKDAVKQPKAASAVDHDDDSEYETYSLYEEVSDGEWENNQDDPNYFEVSSDEFRKHMEKIH